MGPIKIKFFLLMFCALISCQCVLAAEKTYEGWRLKQTCLYQGQQEIVFCSYGVKVFNPKNGLVILYTTPFKEVTYYNLRTKLTCHIPADKNDNPYYKTVALFEGLMLNDVPVQKPVPAETCGWPSLRYVTNDTFAQKQFALLQAKTIRDNEVMSAIYEVIPSVKGDPLEFKFLCRVYGVPFKNAMPAMFKFTNLSKKIKRHLETESCVKAQIAENEFVVPPNLKTAKTSNAVLAGSDADLMLGF